MEKTVALRLKWLGAQYKAGAVQSGKDTVAFAASATEQVAKVGAGMQQVGGTMTRTLTPAAAVVGVAFKQMGDEYHSGVDALRVGTGATGQALDDLTGSMKKVGAEVPISLGSIGQIMAEVNKRTGVTGEGLEEISKRFAQLEFLKNPASVETVTRVFGDWSIATGDQAAAMDTLFKVSQMTGPSIDRIGQLVVQYGAPLRELGYSFEDAALLMGKWEKEGVNTELAMGGLRQALSQFAREQRDPQQALGETITKINNAGSAAEANAIAMEIFGAEAGVDMARAIQEGRFSIEDMTAALEANGETIGDAAAGATHLSDRMKMVMNMVIGALGPFADLGMVIAAVATAAGPTTTAVGKMLEMVSSVGKRAVLSAQELGVMRAGLAGLKALLPTLGLAALAYELYDISQAADEGRRAAKEFADGLSVDEQSAASMEAGLAAYDAQLAKLEKRHEDQRDGILDLGSAFLDLVIPIHNVEGSLIDTKAALDSLGGITEEEREKWARWKTATGDVAGAFGITAEAAEKLMVAAQVDPSVMNWDEVITAVDDYTAGNVEAAAAAIDHKDALDGLGARSVEVAEMIDALKGAIDRLIGVHLSAFDASTRWEEVLATTPGLLRENWLQLDATTEAGRKNRDVLSDMASQAINHAQAIANESGSIQTGTFVLALHAAQIEDTMRKAGFTEDQIRDMVAQMGLTPENLTTLVQAVGVPETNWAVGEVQNKLNGVSQGANANVTANTSQAVGSLVTLEQLYQRIGREMPLYLNPNAVYGDYGRGLGVLRRAAGGSLSPWGVYELHDTPFTEIANVGGHTLMFTGSEGGNVTNLGPGGGYTPAAGSAAGGGAGSVYIDARVELRASGVLANEKELQKMLDSAQSGQVRRIKGQLRGDDRATAGSR